MWSLYANVFRKLARVLVLVAFAQSLLTLHVHAADSDAHPSTAPEPCAVCLFSANEGDDDAAAPYSAAGIVFPGFSRLDPRAAPGFRPDSPRALHAARAPPVPLLKD